MQNRQASRRGFSVMEIAIVMGIVAIILAGIWGYASSAWESTRQQQLTEEIATVAQNVRGFYAGQAGIGTGASSIGSLWIVGALANANAIPSTMVRNGTGNCTTADGKNICADGPWSYSTAGAPTPAQVGSFIVCPWALNSSQNCVKAFSGGGATGPFQYFAIEQYGIPSASCLRAAMANSGAGAPSGLVDVYINGTGIVNTLHDSLPVGLKDAKGNCTPAAGTSLTLDFIFRLNPGNF